MSSEYTRYLGIDYGSVRIGLALSDPLKIIANGFTTIQNDDRCLEKILTIIKEQNVEKIIIGKPLNLKGEMGTKAEEVLQFIKKLQEITSLEIHQIDERFTSVMAQASILAMGTPKKKRQQNKGKVDEVASAILLQGFLDTVKR
ncbi:MAG TPA: Holliday junction resolvase RuvX [Bacteroidetes bacterium]|nr:Holliday junction resolvase RuvX [Bacteroidota bacterium]